MRADEFLRENDDDDHGYLPTPLRLGDYRDPYNPRDYGPYDDKFKDNQDLRDIVENLIDAGVEPAVVMISPRLLTATQDWLADARYRDSDPLFGDYEDRPVVLKYRGVDYILDGHHRCSSALRANQKLNVYMFTAPQGVDEGWKNIVGAGALALGALGSGGAHATDQDNAQQYAQLTTKYYNALVQRAKEDGREFDTRTLNNLKSKAYDSATAKLQQNKPQPAAQSQQRFPSKGSEQKVAKDFNQFESRKVAENFADGKGPGRPGDSVRHGIPKKATMAELERASHASGRKGQLARWQLNMRRGHKK